MSNASTPSDSLGIRPDHLWTVDYVKLLWSDTGAVLTAPAHWDNEDWMYAGFAAAGIGGTALWTTLSRITCRPTEQRAKTDSSISIRTSAPLGHSGLSEPSRSGAKLAETRPRRTPSALTASIIGPGLIGTSMKYAIGRVRPNTATRTFEFKPFSNNQSFPSGHASQAFAVATAIAENYPVWWVKQG